MCDWRTVSRLVVLALMVTSLSGAAHTGANDRVDVTLLITSGTSGRLFGDDGATVASLAATVRAEADHARSRGHSVVILDAGRTLLPYAESRHDGGAAMARVLAASGCAVFVPAPMDFALGMARLAELAAEAPFEVVRPFDVDEGQPGATLPLVAEVELEGGLVLEVRNLIAPALVDDLAAAGVVEARPVQESIEPVPSNRLRLAVVHPAGRRGLASRTMTWRLVESPGGLDLLIDPELGSDIVLRSVSTRRPVVLVGRDRDDARPWTVARVELEVVGHDGDWQVSAADLEVVEADPAQQQNPELVAVLDAAREHFLAHNVRPLPDGAPATRDELEQFVLAALRERARAEVAVLNRGALRPVADEHLEGGRLTRETVARLLSIDQFLVSGSLTGAELQSLAAESVRRVRPDGTLRMDSLVFAGVTFDVKDGGTPDATVGNVQVNGRRLREGDRYAVVTNSFLASGGDEYPVLAEMERSWLQDEQGAPLELREDVVVPRLGTAADGFVDLDRQALWHWGVDRLSLGFNSVTTSHDPAYDDVSDSRARADDSLALLAEVRAFTEMEKPTWAWQNLLWGRYGVLDVEGAERRETDDHLRVETSLVFTEASLLGGGHPYASFTIDTEFAADEDRDGLSVPRRFEQSLAAGIDWTKSLWPRVRLGLVARNYSNIDRDPQLGVTAEAFFLLKDSGRWPGIDAHVLGEHLEGGDSSVSRFDLDLRLLFPLYGNLKLAPAFNYYIYRDSQLTGSSQYFRFSLALSYSWEGRHQSW